MNRSMRWLAALFLIALSGPVSAQVPSVMQFQGFLTDAEGAPLSGVHTVTFTLYDAAEGGTEVWTDTQSAAVENGAFAVLLGGSGNPMDANVFGGTALWLGVTVNEGAELTPRSEIGAVPYAARASVADDVPGHIHPSSVTIDGKKVIDESGAWVGDTAGLQGSKGDTGEQGLKGEKGDTGLKGDKGDTGSPGADGLYCWDLDGNGMCDLVTEDLNSDTFCDAMDCIGPLGQQGLPGATGDKGEQGLKGDKGDTGSPGADGLHCWDLDGSGSCDLLTEDNNVDGACTVDDCFSKAYADLGLDGRLDNNEDTDLLTHLQADGRYLNVGETDSVASAMIVNNSIQAADLLDGACLAEILDDDGEASGLDADLLDGQQASAFAAAGHNHNTSYAALSHNHSAADMTSGTLLDARLSTNVAMRTSANTFSGSTTFSSSATFSSTVSVSGASAAMSVDSAASATFNNAPSFTKAAGSAPFSVTSTTLVTNLNADAVDGIHASAFATASDLTAALSRITLLEAAILYTNDVVLLGSRLWQKTLSTTTMTWAPAVAYCSNLVLAGYDDWRLPTISELRSLIRGCAATATGGSCGVTDACSQRTVCWSSACNGCTFNGGPDGGCYWPSALEGGCYFTWSSTDIPDYGDSAWGMNFIDASTGEGGKTGGGYVRCVR
jgi:hypothetical protein